MVGEVRTEDLEHRLLARLIRLGHEVERPRLVLDDTGLVQSFKHYLEWSDGSTSISETSFKWQLSMILVVVICNNLACPSI